jgi:hypothetical protein
MKRMWTTTIGAAALVALCAAGAHAENISAKKMSIKDNSDPAKRQLQLQSGDAGVQLSEGGTAPVNGAALHVYGGAQDFCLQFPGGSNWKSSAMGWQFQDKATKSSLRLGDGRLQVKLKGGVTYSLAGSPQGAVNALVKFSGGSTYCMKCTMPSKDDTKSFGAKSCVAAACAAEPSPCNPSSTPTSSSSTTSTTATPPPAHVVGALPKTTGRFNYMSTLGVPGADSACNAGYAGSHACTYAELVAAPASDMIGLKATDMTTVTALWTIGSSVNATEQCQTTIAWDYATAHTGKFPQVVNLTNATGVIGSLTTGSLMSGITCAQQRWVACCQ